MQHLIPDGFAILLRIVVGEYFVIIIPIRVVKRVNWSRRPWWQFRWFRGFLRWFSGLGFFRGFFRGCLHKPMVRVRHRGWWYHYTWWWRNTEPHRLKLLKQWHLVVFANLPLALTP